MLTDSAERCLGGGRVREKGGEQRGIRGNSWKTCWSHRLDLTQREGHPVAPFPSFRGLVCTAAGAMLLSLSLSAHPAILIRLAIPAVGLPIPYQTP